MAGSYSAIVDDAGRLRDTEGINGMLECMSGDVVECVEEMYGMIWWLATEVESRFSETRWPTDEGAAGWVKEAQQRYREGLALSPGTGAELPRED